MHGQGLLLEGLRPLYSTLTIFRCVLSFCFENYSSLFLTIRAFASRGKEATKINSLWANFLWLKSCGLLLILIDLRNTWRWLNGSLFSEPSFLLWPAKNGGHENRRCCLRRTHLLGTGRPGFVIVGRSLFLMHGKNRNVLKECAKGEESKLSCT